MDSSLHVRTGPGRGYVQIRSINLAFYLLYDEAGTSLVDTGFVGDLARLQQALTTIRRQPQDIGHILLTHGHLDHAFNAHRFKQATGARVAVHTDDLEHVEGRYPYRGSARLCGALEALGRGLLGYTAATVDDLVDDDDVIPVWGGLRVVHLPGHTAGHCGFLAEREGLLFSGDLFANDRFGLRVPPRFLNSQPERIAASLHRAVALRPEGVFPNHCNRASPQEHKRRLEQLARRRSGSRRGVGRVPS